jgi:hypothetical protein
MVVDKLTSMAEGSRYIELQCQRRESEQSELFRTREVDVVRDLRVHTNLTRQTATRWNGLGLIPTHSKGQKG